MVQDLNKKLLLLRAFTRLPENCDALNLFRVAYLYRQQFEYLAESGSEEDPTGLAAAVSRALSLSLDFGLKNKKVYASSGKGIDTVPWNFLGSSLSDNFKQDLRKTVPCLPHHSVQLFFDSLDREKLNYQNPGKLQWAVAQSLQNYARTATVGTVPSESHAGRRAGWVDDAYEHLEIDLLYDLF